jgi:hypothetical protein
MEEDFVEFYNATSAALDISGWTFTDADPTDPDRPYTFPAGTIVQPGAVIVRDGQDAASPHFMFGLGASDRITLRNAAGTLIDEFIWTEHVNTFGRCPDGTGIFADMAVTKGTTNDCDDTADGGTQATGRRRTR